LSSKVADAIEVNEGFDHFIEIADKIKKHLVDGKE